MRDTSFVVAPIRDHAFFQQAVFQRQVGHAFLQGAGFAAQVLYLSLIHIDVYKRQKFLNAWETSRFPTCTACGRLGRAACPYLQECPVVKSAWKAPTKMCIRDRGFVVVTKERR